jgi:hypothetical protein
LAVCGTRPDAWVCASVSPGISTRPAQVDRASTVRAPLPVVRDAADDAVFDQNRGVLA